MPEQSTSRKGNKKSSRKNPRGGEIKSRKKHRAVVGLVGDGSVKWIPPKRKERHHASEK